MRCLLIDNPAILWKTANNLTVVQAALLMVNSDPSILQHCVFNPEVIKPDGFYTVLSILDRAIYGNEIDGVEIIYSHAPYDNIMNSSLTTIHVPALKQWLLKHEINAPFFFSDTPKLDGTIKYIDEANGSSEQRNYISDDLRLLNRAAVEFWSTADPEDRNTHPKQAEVENWLKQQGLSFASAAQGAVIIRPEWGALGRRSKK
jgi:hypothetical protein